MACVLVLSGDLLFGSRVQGALAAAGHDVELLADERRLRSRLGDRGAPVPAALVVDLTGADLDGAAIVASLRAEGALPGTRTLAFYSHVDAPARERAEQAGVDRVVPRSRMAREAPELIATLISADPAAR